MSSRSIVLAALSVGTGLGILARSMLAGPSTDLTETPADLSEWLRDYEIELAPAPQRARMLRWRAPEECTRVYRVRVDEDMPDGIARLFNRSPEHSEAWLALGPHAHPDAGADEHGLRIVRGRAYLESDDAGVKSYGTTDPLPVSSSRDFYLSGLAVGPSAPDAACRNRSWDAVEDALALGWPWFTLHRLRPGETWAGAPVEARCNETACLTDDGVAGERAHERTCATPAWREALRGEAWAGELALVALEGSWRDRDDLEQIEGGTSTTRQVLFSPHHGRLAWARIQVLHRWSQVRREIVIESVDACPGSLRAAGWNAPRPIVERAAQVAEGAATNSREANANPPR